MSEYAINFKQYSIAYRIYMFKVSSFSLNDFYSWDSLSTHALQHFREAGFVGESAYNVHYSSKSFILEQKKANAT